MRGSSKQSPATLLILVTVSACGAPAPASVHLDLQGLAALATNMPIDEIELRVSGGDSEPVVATVPVAAMSVDLEVSPGQRFFEVFARGKEGDFEWPTYFGDGWRQVAAQGDTDVTIPLFPAGELLVYVTVSGNAPPPDALVRFIPRNPLAGQSLSYSAPFRLGRLERVLPVGSYGVQAEVSFDGKNYSSVGDEISVSIEHGRVIVERIDI